MIKSFMQSIIGKTANTNNTNSSEGEDDDMPRVDKNSDSDPPTIEIDPVPLQDLVEIAVNILKQTIDNENKTMTNLVSIAVDILKQTVGPPPSESIYTMLKPDVRYKDLTFKVTHKDNGQEQPESTMSTITVLYDDVNDKLKITGYKIKNGENCENGENGGIYKTIIDELNLGKLNLETLIEDLKSPEQKTQIITNIIKNLKEKNKIADNEEKIAIDYLNLYLDKLGEAVSKLKRNTDSALVDVNDLEERIKKR